MGKLAARHFGKSRRVDWAGSFSGDMQSKAAQETKKGYTLSPVTLLL